MDSQLVQFMEQYASDGIMFWSQILKLPHHYGVYQYRELFEEYGLTCKVANDKFVILIENTVYFLYGIPFYGEYKYPKDMRFIAKIVTETPEELAHVLYMISKERADRIRKTRLTKEEQELEEFKSMICPVAFKEFNRSFTEDYLEEEFGNIDWINLEKMTQYSETPMYKVMKEMYGYKHLLSQLPEDLTNIQEEMQPEVQDQFYDMIAKVISRPLMFYPMFWDLIEDSDNKWDRADYDWTFILKLVDFIRKYI